LLINERETIALYGRITIAGSAAEKGGIEKHRAMAP